MGVSWIGHRRIAFEVWMTARNFENEVFGVCLQIQGPVLIIFVSRSMEHDMDFENSHGWLALPLSQ
jgi:hypothetical protein